MIMWASPPHRWRLHDVMFWGLFDDNTQNMIHKKASCASPSNATPGVRPLGRTPRISSTAMAFPWRQWPDPSAAFKYGLGLYPRQAIGRSATDWWKSYRDQAQIIYLLSPNNQWPAINWQQFIHWLGSRNKQVPARHSYSTYEYKEII